MGIAGLAWGSRRQLGEYLLFRWYQAWECRITIVPPLRSVIVLYRWNITVKFSRVVRGEALAVHNLHNNSGERMHKLHPVFSGIMDAHSWELTAFTVMLSSSAKLHVFPFQIIMWQWITEDLQAVRPKIGLGAENGWCWGNLSCAQPWFSKATASTSLHLWALWMLLGAISFPCPAGYSCDAAFTGNRGAKKPRQQELC